MENYQSSKFLTPKAKQLRRKQLERLGFEKNKIDEIVELEFDLGGGKAPGTPLPGKRFANGALLCPNVAAHSKE